MTVIVGKPVGFKCSCVVLEASEHEELIETVAAFVHVL